MPIKEFWNEDPNLLWAYRKSYMDKLKIEREQCNYTSWLNGLYVFDAVSKSIYNSFGRKETQQPAFYIERPYDFNQMQKTEKEIKREQVLKVEEQIRERNRQIKEMLNKK